MSFLSLDNIEEIQGIAKLILLIIIISNFIIIFGLKFQINVINKIKSMFDIKNIKTDISLINPVLIIITSIQDELSYWGPTIKTLIANNIKLNILCLAHESNDNEDAFGVLTKIIKSENSKFVKIANYTEENISQEIKKYLDENKNIGTILTFDENSNNKEHINCYLGLEHFVKNNRQDIKDRGIKIFLLDSFGCLMKYSFIIPFIFFYFKEHGYIISNCFSLNKWLKFHDNIKLSCSKRIFYYLNPYSYFNSFTKVELK